jgi:hypothetical protein
MAKFSLKEVEAQLLRVTHQQMMNIITNEMALIAIERLNYQVTEQTRFEFNADMSEVEITEAEVPTEEAGIVTEAPKEKK